MLRDAIENLAGCTSGACFAWHGVLGCGALLLGLWFAYELWCRPYRDEARVYMDVLRDRAQLKEELEKEERSGGGGEHSEKAGEDGASNPLLMAADRARRQRRSGAQLEPGLGWKAVKLARHVGVKGSNAGPDARAECRPGEVAREEGVGAVRTGEPAAVEEVRKPAGMEMAQASGEDPAATAETGRDRETGAAVPALQKLERRTEVEYGGSTGGAEVDEDLGIVFRTAPSNADELTRIPGIDDWVATRLRECGVYRFRQIADWSMDNVRSIAAKLNLPAERILRERWISRATALAEGGTMEPLPAVRRKLRA